MNKTVAFVCSNGTHVRTFSPVARLLHRAGLGVRWLALDAYHDLGAEDMLKGLGWTDVQQLERPQGSRGTPWDGALARIRILRGGRRAIPRVLQDMQPDVLVLGNDIGTLERIFILEAARLGIHTLLVQDGVIALRDGIDKQAALLMRLVRMAMTAAGLRLPDARGYGLGGTDRIAVMGPAVARWLESQGVPARRIGVTGQPRYDALYRLSQAQPDRSGLADLHLPEDSRMVLFCSQPYARDGLCTEAQARSIWETVVAGVWELGAGHHLIAKLHPAEDLEGTRQWLGRDLPAEWTLTRDWDIFELLCDADVLVTVSSSTALEAIYLRKPVVLLDAGLGPSPIPYVEEGAALGARSPGDLTGALRGALYDSAVRNGLARARARFVSNYMGAMDGRASERVADEIMALVSISRGG